MSLKPALLLVLALLLAVTLTGVAGCSSSGGTEGTVTWTPYSTDPVALYPVTVGNKMGYMDKTGTVVIAAQFAATSPFSEGLAAVQPKAGGLWGYIDKTGTLIIEPQFAETSVFSEGAAAVRLAPEGYWGYIDKTGTMVIPPQYAFAWRFSEGYARARTDDKAGYINSAGTWILRMEDYLAVDEFSEGLAPAYGHIANKYGFIDKKGKVVLEPWYEEAWGFTEGVAAVKLTSEDTAGGLYGYIDRNGGWVIQPRFADARPFSEGLAAVQSEVDGKWGYIDKSGAEVIGSQWGRAYEFKEGVALVATVLAQDYWEGLIYGYSYIDTSGNVIWQEPPPVLPATAPTTTTTMAQAATTTTVPASGATTTTGGP